MTDDEYDNMSEEELIAKLADMTENINKFGRELGEHIFEALKAWLKAKEEAGELSNMNDAVFGIALGTVMHSTYQNMSHTNLAMAIEVLRLYLNVALTQSPLLGDLEAERDAIASENPHKAKN